MFIRFLIGNPAATSKVVIYEKEDEYSIEDRGKHWVLKEMHHAARVLTLCGISNRKEKDGSLYKVYSFQSNT